MQASNVEPQIFHLGIKSRPKYSMPVASPHSWVGLPPPLTSPPVPSPPLFALLRRSPPIAARGSGERSSSWAVFGEL